LKKQGLDQLKVQLSHWLVEDLQDPECANIE